MIPMQPHASRKVHLYDSAFVCSECNIPLAIIEVKPYKGCEGCDRRFYVACPSCLESGFRIVAKRVEENVGVVLKEGCCLFSTNTPHRRGPCLMHGGDEEDAPEAPPKDEPKPPRKPKDGRKKKR
jgi:hypothetical protein